MDIIQIILFETFLKLCCYLVKTVIKNGYGLSNFGNRMIDTKVKHLGKYVTLI